MDCACGDCSVAHKSELIEILEFTHFFEHFTFDKTDYSERGKHMKKYIRVVVAVELVTVGAKIEPRAIYSIYSMMSDYGTHREEGTVEQPSKEDALMMYRMMQDIVLWIFQKHNDVD